MSVGARLGGITRLDAAEAGSEEEGQTLGGDAPTVGTTSAVPALQARDWSLERVASQVLARRTPASLPR